MEIRPFTVADYDAARAVWDAVDHLGSVPRWEVEAKLARDPELFLVATDGGAVIGTVMGSYDGRRGWIARLAVVPERQGEGIATALVAELEERMRRARGPPREPARHGRQRGRQPRSGSGTASRRAPPIVLRWKELLPTPSDDPAGEC